MTGRPGCRTMEKNGGSSASYLACAPCVPLFSNLSNRGGNRRAFRLPGASRDHFHCTVEPLSGHIRCWYITRHLGNGVGQRGSIGNGPNTVSKSTVSNTDLSEFSGPHRAPRTHFSEFLSACYLCAKANSPSFSQNSQSLPQNSVSSLFLNSTLKTVFARFLVKQILTRF